MTHSIAKMAGVVTMATMLATVTAVTSASAADLGSPRGYQPPQDFAPPIDRPLLNIERWTGFYLGGTIGAGFGSGRTDGDIGRYPIDQSGMLGTVFAGYNWQIGRTLLGVETDIGTGNMKSHSNTAFGDLRSDVGAMGSLRGRAGVLVTPALLLYGTAGFAWENRSFTINGADTDSKTLLGYQAGIGSELMVSDHVTLRLEYIYTDLERERFINSGLSNRYDADHHAVRAGFSFKF